jgi:uncharacterized protein (TIGR02996 family)
MANPNVFFSPVAPASPCVSNPELEAQIRASRADEAAYLVYADWLTANGDPRGELAMVQHKGLHAREQEILAANGGFLAGVSPEVASVRWKLGTWEMLRFMNEMDWMDPSFDARAVAARLFDHPAAACLGELRVGILRWEENGEDVPALLDEAKGRAFAPYLRKLAIGDGGEMEDVDNAHHPVGDLSVISAAFPRLEELHIWGYEMALGEALELPELRSLRLETCGLSRAALEAVTRPTWAKLERLDLWFGSSDYGSEAALEDLRRLLDGAAIPSVRHLGLMNTELSNEIAFVLGGAKVLAQLESLDLSMGTLDDAGAEALVAAGSAWKHLKTLDVSENFLSDDAIAALGQVGPEILDGEQKDADDDYRYVTVSE